MAWGFLETTRRQYGPSRSKEDGREDGKMKDDE
jgi:hypothetical protein